MREIKFRAWVDSANRMFGPFTLKDFSDGRIYVDFPEGRGYIFIDESELLGYTGLKDKNGKDIYEGDIINVYLGSCYHNYEVRWVGHGFGIEWPDGTVYWPHEGYREIVGNIYENPELLAGTT
jgi:uncharacterized phage protein (TIGR01671 family)